MKPIARRATFADRAAILDILGGAFEDDPFVGWVTRRRPRARRRYLELVLDRLTMPHGHVYLTDVSVSLWVPPGAWALTLGQQLRMLPAVAGIVGIGRLGRMARASEAIEAERPGEYWYLALIATRKEARGSGAGSAVMTPVLERCDEEAQKAVLETSHPPNLAWYGRFGFETGRRLDLGSSAPPVWSLVRAPKT
ncbi:MAG: GNAT family N-acetyltransferase [Myxococcota bacterium]